MTALIHSGLKPNQLTSLAALDSTRLQQALAHEFGVQQDKVTGAHTYGGHGESELAVFASQVKVDGKPLSEMVSQLSVGKRLSITQYRVVQTLSSFVAVAHSRAQLTTPLR